MTLPNGIQTTISACDEGRVQPYSWCAVKRSGNKHDRRSGKYVHARVNGRHITLHRFIMNAPKGMEVDHLDGNGLNNTRENLRIVTRQENAKNRRRQLHREGKQFPGAYLDKRSGRWWSRIRSGGVRRHLGTFDSAEAASRAYLEATAELEKSHPLSAYRDSATAVALASC